MSVDATFSLEIPATAGHVGTARSFTSALLRQLGAPDEIVQDAKLAVSEACSDAVVALQGRGSVRLRATALDGRLILEIDAPGGLRHSGLDPSAPGLSGSGRLELVRSLFADADLAGGPGGSVPRLRFSIALD